MSAGGSFAGTVSQAFAAQSTVIYGATSQPNLVATTEIPIQFCLMENDAILDPGDDELAASYSQQLNDRGICSSYYLHSGYAFYPAYFQRVGLTAEASMAIFQDLQTNEWINDASYFVGTVAELQVAFQLAPAQWPSLLSLSTMERAAVGNLLAVAGAEHQFFAAHNQRTISFLLDACAGGPSSTPTNLEISLNGRLYPNPSGGEIWLDTGAEVVGYQIFDSRGRLRKAGEYRRGERLTLDWSSGLYFFVIEQPEGTTYLRFILD
ncbi:MAG: T9SS type A sorting domain-containing protein [Bacteroidota bacterium]